jgi:cytochrome c oxidase subunit 2
MLNAILGQVNQATTKASFWMPEKVSTVAEDVDNLYDFVNYLSIFFFVLIALLLIFFIVKYRHREDGVPHEPAAGHSTALELTWTLIPAVLVLVIFYFGFRGFMNMSVEPPNSYEIDVTAQTWNWTFTYEGRYVSPDGNLHIPVDTPVRLILTSKDVIHDLFLPEFRMKKDAVPGRYNRMWVQAKYTGNYEITCAEYCGDRHSQMLARVIVHPKNEFPAWLEIAKDLSKTMSPIDAGALLWKTRGCNGCHSIDGSPNTGPTFKDAFGKPVPVVGAGNVPFDENYVRESILYPQAKIHQGFPNPSPMPSFLGQLNDWEIGAIIAFQKSISTNFKGDLSELRKIKPKGDAATQPTTKPGTPSGGGVQGGGAGNAPGANQR